MADTNVLFDNFVRLQRSKSTTGSNFNNCGRFTFAAFGQEATRR